jgi:hypothetical protein
MNLTPGPIDANDVGLLPNAVLVDVNPAKRSRRPVGGKCQFEAIAVTEWQFAET